MTKRTHSLREKLKQRRYTETLSFDHDSISFMASLGWFDDNILSEIFLTGGKPGSALSIMANEASIILSIALQHGTPLSTIRDGLPKLSDGSPAGPMGAALRLAKDNEKLTPAT